MPRAILFTILEERRRTNNFDFNHLPDRVNFLKQSDALRRDQNTEMTAVLESGENPREGHAPPPETAPLLETAPLSLT
jgi:hypothetical protein